MQHGQSILVLRRLLARIRDVMAGEGSSERRLAQVVGIIAEDMGTDVCSAYVRRAGDVVELFATKGLNPEAVHQTRLRIGEGLIGEIAVTGRPMALIDAPSHPKFVYRPETGEEIFHSFMGVPVLRDGRVIGVLAVQHVRPHDYSDEEIEALQTVAMVLAELIASGDLVGRNELAPAEGNALLPIRLEGVRLHGGLGIGIAVRYEPRFSIQRLVAEDTRVEHERLSAAVQSMHGAIEDMLRATDFAVGGEHREILETYRLIAQDVGWLRRIGEAINTGLTAEAAVQRVQEDTRSRMNKLSDPYLRERVHDLEDLANSLLQHLLGIEDASPDISPRKNAILIARNMGPAQLLDFRRHRIRGLILEEGSPNAHVAIVARALDIPMIGQVRDALSRIDAGDEVVVDADHAQVFVRPGDEIKRPVRQSLRIRSLRKAAYAADRKLPPLTKDGVRITLHVNAGLLVDLNHLEETGADGIGLYRTEIPFLVRSELPTVESQQQLYTRVLEYARDKPVYFRTLDVGGDKVNSAWHRDTEENPAMGWRAIRVSFDRPAMLRQQLRALIRAAAGRELAVMFPMIAEVRELDYARSFLDRELARHERSGQTPPTHIRVGAMLEVPALVFQLESLLTRVDFVSVGTNDLLQFLFASDRASNRMAHYYDPLSPVALEVLRSIVRQCDAARVPVGICGEMAGSALDMMALLGIGYRCFSVPPPLVGSIKRTIRDVDLRILSPFVETLCERATTGGRQTLRAFALDHGIAIDAQ